MKKLTMVTLVLALAMLSSGAFAAYVWQYAGTATDNTQYATGRLGVATLSTTAYSVSPTADVAVTATLQYSGTPGAGDFAVTAVNSVNTVASANAPAGNKWLVTVFAESGFSGGQMQLRLWGGSSSKPTLNAGTPAWKVSMLYDGAAGQWLATPLVLSPVGGITATTTGSQASPWFSYTMTTKKSAAPASTYGYIFEISPVPEPGSLFAMMTGLVGLVGFGIRRRK